VLSDGANTYLYGNNRIAGYSGASPEYYLTDALGSVRQIADSSGAATLDRSYQPYGEMMASAGAGATSYGYTGEWRDSAPNPIYLRTWYYSPYLSTSGIKDN